MKRILGIILTICMLLSILPTNVFAAATDILVTSAAYHNNGDVKSIDINFGWDTASATSKLTVMSERLRSAGEVGTNEDYGDFTDLGYYGKAFNSWDAVIAQADKFGMLYYTDEQNIKAGKSNSITLLFDKGDVPINVDKTYYVYLWTYWGGHYYPDNLFMVLQVKNGKIQYASAKGRNDYGSFTVLKEGTLDTSGSSSTTDSSDTSGSTAKPGISPSQSNGGVNSTSAKFNELSLNEYEWEVLRLCNIERAKEGLNALSMIGTLQSCCDIREKELVTHTNHTRPNGEDWYTVIPDDFEWTAQGENVAGGQSTPAAVVDAWMNSPGHRANILNPEYGYMGVGYNSNGKRWVQIFSSIKGIKNVTTNAPSTILKESESTKYYIEIEAKNGYVSYMPVDFNSMKKVGSEYRPRLDCASTPVFQKASETVKEEKPTNEPSSNTTVKTETTTGIPAKYEFVSHPETTGQTNLNANLFLSDREFISADNTYYFVGSKDVQIDPVVYQKIDNIVSYAYYNHSISPGNTQRNLVAADGTLYGVTWKGEKKVLATNVKKTSMNHYLTKDGKLIELTSGKVIATDCKDFAEANTAWTIGAIKNDGSFWLGYTYKGDATAYKRGLEKKLDSAKLVVPEGVVDSNNRFYRWNETVTKMGMDENAWSMGFFQEKNDYKVDLVYVCDNAYRVFPSEKLSKIGVTSEERVHETITGFVLTKSGDLYGYGFWYNEKFGNFGMVEEIFTLRDTATDGNFVGIKSEGSNVINAIVCRACDNKHYIQGKIYDEALKTYPEFYTVTRNGFLATNGKVYSVDRDSQGVKNKEIYGTPNQDADFGQMHRGTQTFKAFGMGKNETINLLPSVTSWAYDNSNICLLERKDGSVWMSVLHRSGRNAAITESLGGYENSNAILVSGPTSTAGAADYISVDGETKTVKTQFSDVVPGAYYAEPVQWAVDKGITTGTTPTTFSPDNTCTRAQILTFMWRAVGSPKMSGSNPFSDVKQSDYYYDAALWASSKGMVTGTKFEGNTPCTRSATVVYLYKNASSPKVSKSNTFTDVKSNAEYASAVAWAVENGITTGTTPTTFSPDTTCTRGQIVTFLQRALK